MNARPHPLAAGVAMTARALSGVNARWVDCRPSAEPRIYYANHTSHMDFAVLWASLPGNVRRRARPVAARDYWERGALRRYFSQRVFRAVLVERGNGGPLAPAVRRELFDRMLAALDAGESLIIFPEGTRGTGDYVAPFKAGIYHLAQRRPHLDFVPVFLHNLNRILPKGEVLPVPLIAQVVFGPPIRLHADETKAEFLQRARDALCRLQEI
jgi:1-acyl-sn-glycerol-3-phosphate acyltransferase